MLIYQINCRNFLSVTKKMNFKQKNLFILLKVALFQKVEIEREE